MFAIEYAFSRTKRFREVDEERDGRFPWFRRYDAYYWKRLRLYPGAIFIMPARFLLLALDGLFLMTVLRILTIGHDFKKGPIKNGCRKWIMSLTYYICCSVFLFLTGMRTSLHYDDVDYTYYLGPNYKIQNQNRRVKRVSTIVSNHVSWLDCVILIKSVRPAFAVAAEFEKVPLLGHFSFCLDSIFIPRGGSDENKKLVLQKIKDRQELIEETGKYAPFCIFSEGGASNGTSIMKFKKGAFFAEKTIRPIYLKYSNGCVSPAFEVMEFLPLTIFQLSWCFMKCDIHVLPDFQPTEYLFSKHSGQGEERWEIFAWAVRDIMAREGDFGICDVPIKKKLQYEAYMQLKPDALHPNEIELEQEAECKISTMEKETSKLIQIA